MVVPERFLGGVVEDGLKVWRAGKEARKGQRVEGAERKCLSLMAN